MERTPDTNQTTDKIPHSGNLPGELREAPINNFDNTPLSDAPLNELNIQDVLPTEVLPVAEKKKSKKGLLIGASAGLAGVALVAGSIIGINSANSGAQETEPPVADPKGTTEVEETDTIDSKTEFLMSTEELSVNEFLDLSQEIQLKYSLAQVHEFRLSEKIEEASWTTPSLENSAQQIFENFRYVRNTATAQSKPNTTTGDVDFDPIEAAKLLSGAYDNTFNANPSPGLQNYEERREFILTLSGPYVNTRPAVLEDYSANTPITKNGEELVYRDILFHEADSEDSIMRFIYRTYIDIEGEEQGMWLHDSSRRINTEVPES